MHSEPIADALDRALEELAFETVADAPQPATRRPDKIQRFLLPERLLHWSFALPFLVCLGTAVALVFYYNPDPTRPHREIVSWVHRIAGICFVGLPIGILLASMRYRKVFWGNMKEGLVWTLSDIKWLLLMPFAMISKRVRLPEEGKFNAGEKLNFGWTVLSGPIFGVTGLAIWLGSDYGVLPWLGHFGAAIISSVLVLGHLYMALINPSSRKGLSGMFSGRVDRAWAKHHYRRWYRDNFEPSSGSDAVMQRSWAGRRAKTRAETVIEVSKSLSPVTAIFLLLLGAGLFVAGMYSSRYPERTATSKTTSMLYASRSSALWSTASDEAAPIPGGPLVQGTRVELVSDSGEYALVVDQRGRAGYLYSTDLLEQRPPFDEEVFAVSQCRPLTGEETDDSGCLLRANEKLEFCTASCTDADTAPCEARCQSLFEECTNSCSLSANAEETADSDEGNTAGDDEEDAAASDLNATVDQAANPEDSAGENDASAVNEDATEEAKTVKRRRSARKKKRRRRRTR